MIKTFEKFIFIVLILAIIYFLNNNFLHLNLNFNSNKIETVSEDISSKDKNQNSFDLNFEYKVSKIIDGDTLKIEKVNGDNFLSGNSEITVRLIGINTPETVATNRPIECFGKEAGDEAKSLANGEIVALELDESQGELDKYGRTLAYVYVKTSGLEGYNYFMLNKKLLEGGFAYEYTYNNPYKYQNIFKSLENDAKENEKGL